MQPLIDNAGAVEPAKPVEEVEEYLLVIPGIGLEFQTAETNEPIYIYFNDLVDTIRETYADSITYDYSDGHTMMVIERDDIGIISVFDRAESKSFAVILKPWKLSNGLGIGSTREELVEHYGEAGTFVEHDYYIYTDTEFGLDENDTVAWILIRMLK